MPQKVAVDAANTEYFAALAAGTGDTTEEDVAAAINDVTAAEKVRADAQIVVDTAAATLVTATAALPEGLAAARRPTTKPKRLLRPSEPGAWETMKS